MNVKLVILELLMMPTLMDTDAVNTKQNYLLAVNVILKPPARVTWHNTLRSTAEFLVFGVTQCSSQEHIFNNIIY